MLTNPVPNSLKFNEYDLVPVHMLLEKISFYSYLDKSATFDRHICIGTTVRAVWWIHIQIGSTLVKIG